jgi:hypothetical protein
LRIRARRYLKWRSRFHTFYVRLPAGARGPQSIPSINPFKLPRRSSTTALSQLGAESGRSDEAGDSYVIVDKDFVEVNAFADGMSVIGWMSNEFGQYDCAKLAIMYTLTLWSAVAPLLLSSTILTCRTVST